MTMRLPYSFACAVLVFCLTATPASAQERVPDSGMGAITLSLGGSFPFEEFLDNGWFMAVSGEAYLTPRISIKGQLGGAWHNVNVIGLDDEVAPMHITGSLIHNWERGKWHPYAGAGVGLYRYRFGENEEADNKFGVNLGGGIEYFFTRRDVIQGDITFHIVPGEAESRFWDYNAKYWTLSAGYKRYF